MGQLKLFRFPHLEASSFIIQETETVTLLPRCVQRLWVCTHQQKDRSYMKSAGADRINFQQIKSQCENLQLIIISREDGTEGAIESGRSIA